MASIFDMNQHPPAPRPYQPQASDINQYRFDVQKLVGHCYTRTGQTFDALCLKHGFPVPAKGTMKMWKWRRALPHPWLAVLALIAEREGFQLTLSDFVIFDENPR